MNEIVLLNIICNIMYSILCYTVYYIITIYIQNETYKLIKILKHFNVLYLKIIFIISRVYWTFKKNET